MPYFTEDQLMSMGFKSLGRGVKISDKASVYNHGEIEIGDNSRIDDFCVVSGKVQIGSHSHITPMCLVAGGVKGVFIGDFVALSYGVKVFSQSDDYSGATMTNSTVPAKFKKEIKAAVRIGRHCIIGAGSSIMPGVELGEGVAVGAMSLVLKNVEPWTIVAGAPARVIRARSRDMLELEQRFIAENEEGRRL